MSATMAIPGLPESSTTPPAAVAEEAEKIFMLVLELTNPDQVRAPAA